jgi:hypothetical protein
MPIWDEYHALVFPCRRDGSGWRDVRANQPLPLQPTHWRETLPDVFSATMSGRLSDRLSRAVAAFSV